MPECHTSHEEVCTTDYDTVCEGRKEGKREGRREGRREVEMSAAQERVRVRVRSVSVLEWYWTGCWTLPRKEQERWWTRRQ